MVDDTGLLQRVAETANCTVEVVEQTMNDYGLNLLAPARRHRSLRLDRLRVRGHKAGNIEPGEFDETFAFKTGVTVIAADNLKGKTSILELVTLVLRGERRDLQADVLSWLTNVSLDVHINGQPIGFRISLQQSEITQGRILAGSLADLALSDDAPAEGTATLHHAESSDDWAAQVGAYMMTQLGLDEIQVFNRSRSDEEAGTIKSHGWPAYYSVIYPPAAADRVLLGSTAGDFLPVRLMQVFLDMPDATRSMRISALTKRLDSEFKAELRRRGGATNAPLTKQLEAAEARRLAAEEHLSHLDHEAPAESLQELAQLAATAGTRLTRARQAAEASAMLLAEAQTARIADERALTALRESTVASAFFHGFDPGYCPRCETAIAAERKLHENETHHCAVCDTAVALSEDDDYQEREQQAVDALAASKAAEKSLDAAWTSAKDELTQAQSELEDVDSRIEQAQAARQLADRADAEREFAAAIAVVQALEAMDPGDPNPPAAFEVLSALEQILREEIVQASRQMYQDLSESVRDLAVSFGIGELEGVKVKANGHMDITKGGGAKSGFGDQSPGERLRLRYALVVALLRTARVRGIAGHPGLLLLDSLKAEEVQDDHAKTLLDGLVTAAVDEPGLQILVTTADQTLAEVSGVAATITPKPGRSTLF